MYELGTREIHHRTAAGVRGFRKEATAASYGPNVLGCASQLVVWKALRFLRQPLQSFAVFATLV